MLTIRENFVETLKGGKPDRFVNQYEYAELMLDPVMMHCTGNFVEGTTIVNDWGVTVAYPVGEPACFPVQDDEHVLLHDITEWRTKLHAPDPNKYAAEEWAAIEAQAAAVDRKNKFVAPWFVHGIFEKIHMFLGMEEAMVALYTEPEEMHALIDYLTEWELEVAKVEIKHYQPDLCFHHDDWGSQRSLFMSPEMFHEFLYEPYKKIYGFWKANGAEYVVHHNDGYGAELVPQMIEMGIDVFQGATIENNIPKILKQYGGKMSIQAGLDNGKFDKQDWTKEGIYNQLDSLIRDTDGGKFLIPSFTMGGPGTTYPGAYEYASEAIDQLSKKYFG